MVMKRRNRIASTLLAILLAWGMCPVAYADEAIVEPATEDMQQSEQASEVVKASPAGSEELSPEQETTGSIESGAPADEDIEEPLEGDGSAGEEGMDDPGASVDPEQPSDPSQDEPAKGEPVLAAGTYLIRTLLADSQVVEVANGGLYNCANVQLYESNMTQAQRFRAEVDSRGLYTFVNEKSGKVLDIASGRAENGANVQQYESNGTMAQKWRLVENADGSFTALSALDESLALDVSNGVAANGSNVQVYESNQTTAQKFSFIPTTPELPSPDALEPGVYYLKSALDTTYAIDVPDYSSENGTKLQLHKAGGNIAQMFRVVVDEDGLARILSVNSGKALDVPIGNLVPSVRVQQWDAANSPIQKWVPLANVDGTFTFVSCANGLALDVKGGSAANGSAIQTYTRNGTAAQSWVLETVGSVVADGYYTLVSMLDHSKVADLKNGSFDEGAVLNLFSRNDTPAQKFRIKNVECEVDDSIVRGVTLQSMASGLYLTSGKDGVHFASASSDSGSQSWLAAAGAAGGVTFVNVATGLALDVSGGGTYDGCSIGGYEPNGTPAQAFRPIGVDPVSYGTYIVWSCADGRVLDVANGSRSNGANVQAWTRNGSGAQAWIVQGIGDGYYRVVNARSECALDVAEGVAANGTNVQQWAVANGAAQKWRIVVNDDCSLTFLSACGGLALDVNGGGGYDGANVQIYEQNGTAAQRFRLIPTTYVREDFEDLLGTFTTYSQNTWNGTYNMQKALDQFNGVVLQPGESMSFYGVTGRCGAAEGYLPAGVVGGIGYGGGICQASTTIYGAAIRAGFGIVDRQNHSVPSVYVPIGLDAMVSWGSSDLVVRNDTGHPAKIVTHTYDNVLTCEIWGIQPDWYDSIEPISWYTGTSSAAAQRIFYKNGSAVYTEWLPSSYYW